jgi:hypothetical protein
MSTQRYDISQVTPELLSALRIELIETEKSGADFVKWKLIAVAAVASLALGVGQAKGDSHPPHALICLIPLICAYVDLMSADLAVRILSIAAFLRSQGDVYELWVQDRRTTRWQNRSHSRRWQSTDQVWQLIALFSYLRGSAMPPKAISTCTSLRGCLG